MKSQPGLSRGNGTRAATKERHFSITVKLVPTNEVFPLKKITGDLKIKELKSYTEFATGIPANIQRLHYLDQGDLLDSSDVRSNDIISGAQIHMDVWSMWRTLVIAISSGDMEAIDQLGVSKSSKYSTPNSDHMGYLPKQELLAERGFVALYMAAHRGNQAMCNKLIHGGSDVNRTTALGRTALHVAAASGHGKIVDTLLLNGADINAEDNSGETALSVANKFGHKGCERHLFLFRWQQRAKETEPQPEHEMFAHQYFDSALPVWLKGGEAQIYFTKIMPPGEYEGTGLSAPKRRECSKSRQSQQQAVDVDAEEGELYDSRQGETLSASRSRSVGGMPPITEEVTSSKSGASGGRQKKGKSKTSYDDWLSRKKEAEKQQRDAERQIRQQRLQEKKHKEEEAAMKEESYEKWVSRKQSMVPPHTTSATPGDYSTPVPAPSARRRRGDLLPLDFWLEANPEVIYKEVRSKGAAVKQLIRLQ